jgi:hypothetical protein
MVPPGAGSGNGPVSDLLALRFILMCDTPKGPLYVQYLNAAHRVSDLVDDPAYALEFEAQACQCDEAYFLIEPPLHGSVWEGYRPVPIFPLDDDLRCRRMTPRRPPPLWITLARRLRTFATRAMSFSARWSTRCTQALWTRRRAHEGMGTAGVKAKNENQSDVMQVQTRHGHDITGDTAEQKS